MTRIAYSTATPTVASMNREATARMLASIREAKAREAAAARRAAVDAWIGRMLDALEAGEDVTGRTFGAWSVYAAHDDGTDATVSVYGPRGSFVLTGRRNGIPFEDIPNM